MRVMHLYRPRLPGLRAQAISVVHTAHALASLGHEVTVLADANGRTSPAEALLVLGLQPHPRLHLHISPVEHPAGAGAWFRAQLARWWSGAPGVVVARDKRRLLAAMRWLPRRHRLILETHELDSALARERGDSGSKWADTEAQTLRLVDALVANCGGTLAAWRQAHSDLLPSRCGVVHNGTAPDRVRTSITPDTPVIRYVGSLRAYKGIDTLLAAADDLPAPLELVGGTEEERTRIPAGIRCRPPVPYAEVPDLLASASVLVLPLADNRFGQSLSSPLKLWDYLATTKPIVASDVASIHEIAGMTHARLHLYTPGQPSALVHAVRAALDAPPRPTILRTWDQRAQEIEGYFEDSQ